MPRMIARSILILLSTATAMLFVADARAQGSAPRDLLKAVVRDFKDSSGNRSPSSIHFVGDRIDDLQELSDAPADVREDACKFLKKVIEFKVRQDVLYRWRVRAMRVMATLAENSKWIDFLLKTGATKGKSSLVGSDFYVERMLADVRGPNLRHLFARLTKKTKKPVYLTMALGGLARSKHPDLEPLLKASPKAIVKLTGHKSAAVRAHATKLLGRLDDDLARKTLTKASEDGSALVRQATAEALRHQLGNVTALETLVTLLEDRRPLVREEAATTLGEWPNRRPVRALIKRLDREPLRQRVAVNEALKKLSGMDHPAESKAWKEWLASVEAAGKWDPDDDAASTKPATAPRYDNTYYGVPVLSDRIVFILDISGSMTASGGARTGKGSTTRLGRAKEELGQVLSRLDERSRFNIVTFSSSVQSFAKKLVKATKKNAKKANTFIKRQGASGGTNSYGVLLQVFERHRDVDTVYFLSDGTPTAGKTTVQERILQELHDWNRERGVRVHTIALLTGTPKQSDEFRDASAFMREVAATTGGTFTLLAD